MSKNDIAKLIKNHQVADHPEMVETIMSNLGLSEYLSHYLSITPDRNDIYHGRTHTFNVLLNAYSAVMSGPVGLDTDIVKAAVLAALYHDAGHSLGRETDDVNVSTAQKLYLTASRLITPKETKEFRILVNRTIGATQYPYTRKARSPLPCVIRDADLSILFINDEKIIKQLLVGLLNEVNYRRVVVSGLDTQTKEEYINGLHTFWTSVRWCSKWGSTRSVALNSPKRIDKLLSIAQSIDFE